MPDIIQQVAVKAIIPNSKGEILVLREASTYKDSTQYGHYTLPGGRINPGEPFAAALIREIQEETGLDIIPGKPLYVSEWFPRIKDAAHHIVAVFFECQPLHTSVTLSDEHDDFAWINPLHKHGLDILDMAPLNAWLKK